MTTLYPPGPASDFFGLRHLPALRTGLIGFCSRLQREYGDVAHFRLGPFDCYQFVHPEHIHEVLVRQAKHFRKPARLKQVFGRFEGNGLVVSDGPLWQRQRRLVQPAFQSAQLGAYVDSILSSVRDTTATWEKSAQRDILADIRAIALRILCRALFSTDIDDDDIRQLGQSVDILQHWSMRELNRVWATPAWLPVLGQPKVRWALRFIDQLVNGIIVARTQAAGLGGDLLDRLIAAVDSEGSGGMTARQLRDEVVTLLLAGHETVAAALTWTCWLLARHGLIQERLAGDAQTALSDGHLVSGQLPRLESIEQAFKESLRLYPPVYFLSREVAEPVEIAGYTLKPPSQVYLAPYLTQRDERWFDAPNEFRPERFAAELEQRLPPCAWFPFGAGPRGCNRRSARSAGQV